MLIKKSLFICFVILFCNNAFGYAEATATARAVVSSIIGINQTVELNFGSFTAPSVGIGTINQAGDVTNGVVPLASTRTAAVFAVMGIGNSSYNFTLPATITIYSGVNNMNVALEFASGGASRNLSSGSENVVVNGVLTVAANQAIGNYVGTYQVSVNY